MFSIRVLPFFQFIIVWYRWIEQFVLLNSMSIDVGIISEQTKANCKFIQGNNTLCQDDATNMLQPYTYHGSPITQSGHWSGWFSLRIIFKVQNIFLYRKKFEIIFLNNLSTYIYLSPQNSILLLIVTITHALH